MFLHREVILLTQEVGQALSWYSSLLIFLQ